MLAALEPPLLYLAIAALVIAVVAMVGWRGRVTLSEKLAAVFAVLGVVAVSWNGVRGPGQVAPFDVLFGAAFVALGFSSLRGGRLGRVPGWLLLAAGGLFAAGLLAELFVPNPPAELALAAQASPAQTGQGDATDSDLVTLAKLELALFGVPVLIGAVAGSWRRARLMADLWLLSAVVSAGVALSDLFLGTRVGELATGLPFVEGRASGLTAHSNHLGLASAMALPLALARAAVSSRVQRILAVAASAVLVVGILASGSRANFVAALIALGLTALFLPGARRTLVLGVAAGLIFVLAGSAVAAATGSQIVTFERFRGGVGAGPSDSLRRDRLDRSLSAVEATGLTGVGFASVRDAHNLYLQMLHAGGIVAFAAFAVFAVGAVRLGWRLSRDPRAPPDRSWLATALMVSLLVWLITGLVQNAVIDRYIYVPVGVLLGLRLAYARKHPTAPVNQYTACAGGSDRSTVAQADAHTRQHRGEATGLSSAQRLHV